MKIQLVSDLHLEFSDINVTNVGDTDVLILSGDILIANDLHDHPETSYGMYSSVNLADLGARQQTALRFRDFMRRVSFQFPHVVYVAGNHEFYHGRFHDSVQHLRDECAKFANVHFLERDTVEINDVVFMGATLWTDCNKGDPLTQHSLSDMMNDFRVIRNDKAGFTRLRPAHIMERHMRTKEYFGSVLDNFKAQGLSKKVVVVGHHAPSYQSIDARYKNDHLMNGGYASDLSEFILDHPEIVLWTHGHMHQPFDYMIGTTRVVCNPRGYESWGEDSGWNPELVLEI
jgi:predicted phosphodiesterase